MTDNQKQWLIELYDIEIKSAIGAASNEHLWALGSKTNIEATQHEQNCEELKEYAQILKRFKEDIQKTQ